MVLLTGGSGFIGNRIYELFLQRGFNLKLLTRNAGLRLPKVDCCVGDLLDERACRKACRGVRIVVHVAGEKSNLVNMWPVNVKGTANLLKVALIEGVERFIHISSVGVIGATPLKRQEYIENSACVPHNEYEKSKYEAEKLVKQAAKEGLPAIILRPANVFGDRDPRRGLLNLIKSVRDGRFIFIGGREALCNYVFVDDVAHACLSASEHAAAVGKTFHLSDDCSMGEFINAVAEELKVQKTLYELPPPLSKVSRHLIRFICLLPGIDRDGSISRLIALHNRAFFKTKLMEETTGFNYPVGWREGLRRLVSYYRNEGLL
jgi:UDP-glucose 4-epimerase